MDFCSKDLKILQSEIDSNGEDNQLDITIEEIEELITRLCEYKFLKKENKQKGLENYFCKYCDTITKIKETMASLYIRLEQMKIIFNCDFSLQAFINEKIKKIEGCNKKCN